MLEPLLLCNPVPLKQPHPPRPPPVKLMKSRFPWICLLATTILAAASEHLLANSAFNEDGFGCVASPSVDSSACTFSRRPGFLATLGRDLSAPWSQRTPVAGRVRENKPVELSRACERASAAGSSGPVALQIPDLVPRRVLGRSVADPLVIWFANIEKWGPTAEPFVSELDAHVAGVAEHHLPQAKLEIVKRRVAHRKWFAAPATPSENSAAGTHAGTALLVRRSLAAQPVDDQVWRELFPPSSPGFSRVSACTLRLRGLDLLMVCVYLVTGQPLVSPCNAAIFWQLVMLKKFFRLPMLLMGDWQNTPEQMRESPWPQRLGVKIVAPDVPFTCKQGKGRVIDYFMVSSVLESSARNPRAWTNVPWGPHLGISLELAVEAETLFATKLVAPKPLPPFPAEFNQDLWDRAQAEATKRLLRQAREKKGIFGKSVLLDAFTPVVAPPDLAAEQQDVSEDLAAFSLATEIYALYGANICPSLWKPYLGRGQFPRLTRVKLTTVSLESRFSCHSCNFWACCRQFLSALAKAFCHDRRVETSLWKSPSLDAGDGSPVSLLARPSCASVFPDFCCAPCGVKSPEVARTLLTAQAWLNARHPVVRGASSRAPGETSNDEGNAAAGAVGLPGGAPDDAGGLVGAAVPPVPAHNSRGAAFDDPDAECWKDPGFQDLDEEHWLQQPLPENERQPSPSLQDKPPARTPLHHRLWLLNGWRLPCWPSPCQRPKVAEILCDLPRRRQQKRLVYGAKRWLAVRRLPFSPRRVWQRKSRQRQRSCLTSLVGRGTLPKTM